jgi:hypothetical protein
MDSASPRRSVASLRETLTYIPSPHCAKPLYLTIMSVLTSRSRSAHLHLRYLCSRTLQVNVTSQCTRLSELHWPSIR